MARPGAPRDRGKERFWRRLLRLWQRSGRSVRGFCAEYHVSEASFFAWRRTIVQRDQEQRQRHAAACDSAVHAAAHQATPARASFVPLRVIGTATPDLATAFEVVLGDGRSVRVPAGFDPASFRQLLAVLQEPPSC
jgi:hypothetical protein